MASKRISRGVCGSMGSGKSSFISCILGEIPKISGEVQFCGSAAYVSQSAWIQSGNIKENILFASIHSKPFTSLTLSPLFSTSETNLLLGNLRRRHYQV
ncbi:putative ABC-type xenobiotic transporter [Helianthus debilis subsp. tardiflorus]